MALTNPLVMVPVETFKDMVIESNVNNTERIPMTTIQPGMCGLDYLTYGLKPEYR